MTPRPRLSAGFSLVEMLVAILLFSLVIGLALPIFVESLRGFATAVTDMREPVEPLAFRLLRREIATSFPPPVVLPGFWSSDPLMLSPTGRPSVFYALENEGVWSRTVTSNGARPLLDQVVSFRWRVTGALVEVEVTRRKRVRPSLFHLATPLWRPRGETLETLYLAAASRLQ